MDFADIINPTNQVTLRQIILGYSREVNVITWILKSKRGRQKSRSETCSQRRSLRDLKLEGDSTYMYMQYVRKPDGKYDK